jgi:hypothetical protein
MILPGSYANGFAPRDGSPLYPELWRGCVGAWAPCLGPTGVAMRDWSGLKNHATITNATMTTFWGVGNNRVSITPDGSDDYLNVTDNVTVQPTAGVSGAMWIRPTNVTGTKSLIDHQSLSPYYGYIFVLAGNKLIVNAAYNTNGVDLISMGSISANVWTHVGFSYDAATLRLFINGAQDSSATAAGAITYTSTADLTIAKRSVTAGGYFGGGINDVFLWGRPQNASVFRRLYSRVGIAYDIAPNRRAKTQAAFKAYWSARKAQIIGGGL